jgi:beta-lactamase regulating signal transducer with metallopeptidase domain
MLSAVLFFSGGLLIVAILGYSRKFLLLNSAPFLVIMFILAIIRLVVPIDIPVSLVIRSEELLPQIDQVFAHKLNTSISIEQLLLLVWIIGAVGMVLWKIFCIIRENQRSKKLRTVYDKHISMMTKEIFGQEADTVVSSDIELPMVTGFFKAHIYLPNLHIPDRDLGYVLLHEYQHIQGRDIALKVFYLLLGAVFWWNPLLYIFRKELDNLLEIRCDARVTKKMTEYDKSRYLDAVLSVIRRAYEEKNRLLEERKAALIAEREKRLAAYRQAEAESLAETETLVQTESEIEEDPTLATDTDTKTTSENALHSNLVNPAEDTLISLRFEVISNTMKRKKSHLMSILTILAVVVFIASYFVIIQPAYEAPESDEINNDIITSSQSMYILEKDDGTYELMFGDNSVETITKEQLKSTPYSEYDIVKENEIP